MNEQDTAKAKQMFLQMAVIDGGLLTVAVAFAYAYFGKGVDWALYGFVGFIGAAFAVQMWFMRGLLRLNKGG